MPLVPVSATASPEEVEIARELVLAARARGVALSGPDGLLKALTKTVIETALDEELAEHLGYDKHAVEGRRSGNSRNGTRVKTVLTEHAGAVEIEVPRDRSGSFEPQIVKKRQRRLEGVDTIVLSLVAKGLTTGEVSAHFAEVYGAGVSKGHRLADHREGRRGDGSLDGTAAGAGLRGGVRRRDLPQGSRRPGRQPALLRRDRR